MTNLQNTNNIRIIEEQTATALLVKQSDGSYRLGDETDITIQFPFVSQSLYQSLIRTLQFSAALEVMEHEY